MWLGKVTKITDDQVFVRAPDLDKREYRPVLTTVADLVVGDRVVVTQLAKQVADSVVVIGVLGGSPVDAGGAGGGILGAATYKDTRAGWDPNSDSIIVPSTLDYSQGDASGIGYDGGSQSLVVTADGWYQPWASCKVGGPGSGTTVGTLEVVCGGNGGNAINTAPLSTVYSANKVYLYTLGEPYFYAAGNTFRSDVYADGTPVVSVNAHVGLIALTGP
jgi:hypothetical protein